MNDEQKRVAELIRTAFSGVVLEDGIGLWEAQGIDDYQSKERHAEYRSKDEKEDWSKLTGEDMTYCYSSLSFFDAKGVQISSARIFDWRSGGNVSERYYFYSQLRCG